MAIAAMAVQSKAISLYSLAEDLTAWLDTRECTDPDSEERKECDRAVETFVGQLATKVDSVSWMLGHLESQAAFAAQEIKRLQDRKRFFEAAQEQLEQYCVRVIEALPEPKKGARKIEGASSTLSIRPSEGAILTDEAAVPAEFKTAVVEMPAKTWELLVKLHPQVLDTLTKQDLKVRLADVKRALKAGCGVAGADLEFRSNLVRK